MFLIYFLNLISQVNLASQLVAYSCSKYSDIIYLFIYFENSNSCYLHRHRVLYISYSGIKSSDICRDSYLDLCVIAEHRSIYINLFLHPLFVF